MKQTSIRSILGNAAVAGLILTGLASPGTAAALTTTYSAYSATSAGNLAAATLVPYGGGYGVTYAGESTSSPQHSIDNSGQIDSVRIQFSEDRVLQGLTFGWVYSNDSDFSVLYSKNASPTLLNRTYANLLTSNGGDWMLLKSYDSNGAGYKDLLNSVFAKNWLVVAYGPYNGCATCNLNNDYFKLESIRSRAVPEPGSLALLGLGLLGLGAARRRK